MNYIRALFLLICIACNAQNNQLLFGFNDVPQSVLLNPSTKLDNNWYFGIPLLSKIQLNTGSSGLSVYDLFADDNRDFNTKLQNLVYDLKDNDFFSFNEQIEIISGGFQFGRGFEKNNYLSFGLYQETDVIAYFPKDYAILAYEGNANNIDRVFDLSDLNLKGEVLSVFHIGATKNMNKNLTLGARFKIYSSVFNVTSTKNRGSFVTREGQNNFYNHIFDLDLQVQTSGIKSLIDDDNSDFSRDLKEIRRRLFFGGNLGLGFDLGLTYKFSRQLTLEASLLDIGFIRHSKDVENYELNGDYSTEGINLFFPQAGSGQSVNDYYNNISDDLKDLFDVDSTTTAYTTWRPIKLNSAIKYAFGKRYGKECDCNTNNEGYINAVGAQLFAINRPKQPQFALTAFYYRKVAKGLNAKVTYTIDSFSYTNIGIGVSSNLGPINIYLMGDNLINYSNLARARSLFLQFGINYVFIKNNP